MLKPNLYLGHCYKNMVSGNYIKNGMLRHSLAGEVIFFFETLYCSVFEINALFVLLTWNYCLLAEIVETTLVVSRFRFLRVRSPISACLHSQGTWEAKRAVILGLWIEILALLSEVNLTHLFGISMTNN